MRDNHIPDVMNFSSIKSSVLDIAGCTSVFKSTIAKVERYTWVGTSIDNNVVQYRIRAVWLVGQVVLSFVPYQLFDKVMLAIFMGGLGPHDGCLEPQSQAYCNAMLKGSAKRLLIVGVFKFSEEPQ